eukprot:gene14506-16015_t
MADSNDDFIRGETLDVFLDLLDEELLDEMFQDSINVALEDINVEEKTSASFSCETCRKYYKTKGRKVKTTSRFNSNPYRVTEIAGTRITAIRSDHEITRNTPFFKKYNPSDDENIQITKPDSEVELSDDEYETEIEHEAVHQYPQKIR